jgi:hypothetical protein
MTQLLIIAPTARELGSGWKPPAGASTSIVGLGEAAGPNLRAVLEETKPRAVLSLGFAGALRDGLRTGDVVIADRVSMGDGSARSYGSPTAEAMRAQMPAGSTASAPCDLLTTATVLLTAAEKRRYGEESGAGVVDLEGGWIAAEAERGRVSLVLVRAVLDEVGLRLPALVQTIVDDGGANEWRHAIGFLLRRSLAVRDLIGLASRSRAASRALGQAARAIVPMLMASQAEPGAARA